nr:hypothetical protein BaRGS_014448 [Batillaria attramentaria]
MVVYTDAELVHMIALHLASVGDKLSAEGTPNPCPSLTSKDAINQMFIQVFKDGVYSWEHVGLLFRRTAKACEKALNQTDEILDKVMKLFRASVAPWIVESGGWVVPAGPETASGIQQFDPGHRKVSSCQPRYGHLGLSHG